MFAFTLIFSHSKYLSRGRRGCGRMVIGFTTTYVISAYYHQCCELESREWRGVLDTTLHDKMSEIVTCGRSVVFYRVPRFPPLIKPTATI
jgi:hypothetical protein